MTVRLRGAQTRALPVRTPWRAFADWFMWVFVMKGHRFALIDTDSMGSSCEELPGRILRLWTAPYDSKNAQKGYTYAIVRYADGRENREAIITARDWGPRRWCLFFNDEMQRYERTR